MRIREKIGVYTLIGLIVAVMGLLVPILWDLYKGSTKVSIELVDVNPIFVQNQNMNGVSISYKDKQLSALYYFKFKISNSGSNPIKNSDIISPLTITFSEPDKIIEQKIDESKPKNIGASIRKDDTSENIFCEFSLLNPGDSFSIGVLSVSQDKTINASGRIVGVKKIELEYSNDVFDSVKKKTDSKTVIFWIAGVITVIKLFILSAYLRELHVKYLLRTSQFKIPTGLNRWATRNFLSRKFSFLENEQDKYIVLQHLEKLPDSDNYSGDNHDELLAQIEKLMHTTASNRGPFFMGVVFAVFFWFGYIVQMTVQN